MKKKFFEKIKQNKELQDKKKKLTQENKQVQDEIVRLLALFNNYKSYAVFIHKVMGDNNLRFPKESLVAEPKTEYVDVSKDFEKALEKVLEDFKHFRLNPEVEKAISDSSRLTQKFQEMEDNILKSLEKKQNAEKELELITKNNKKELEELQTKNIGLAKEREKLENEKDKDSKFINHLEKQKKNETSNNEVLDYVRELHEIIMGLKKGEEEIKDLNIDPEKKKLLLTKKKNDNNYINELREVLRIIEDHSIKTIATLKSDQNEREDVFKVWTKEIIEKKTRRLLFLKRRRKRI